MSSVNSNVDKDDISRNGGVVEGVWVFTRHGDRTPNRPLCAPHMIDDEASFWRTKLPTPDPVTAFSHLCQRYPPNVHPSNGDFLDVVRRPFGFLTKKGVEQLKSNGKRFFTRYDFYGHHCPSTGHADGDSFLHSWDVKAYSTNYLRTVLSAQCFLDGLLGTNCYTPDRGDSKIENDEDSRLIPTNKDQLLPNTQPDQNTVPVEIRNREDDRLNAFDRNPELMKKLISDVVASDEFCAYDATAAPLAARLANYLPGLTGRRSAGGPSGINWIDASDHFVCRSAHGVKFLDFTKFEHDNRKEETMKAFAHQVLTHLTWRFRKWYQNPPLLAAIAAPPLREVVSQMEATPSMGINERHPFVLYSCHDVTLLSLLYGIGVDFLADEYKADWRFWPSYASTLVFELVRVKKVAGPDSHVVRILLNGKPLRVVNLLDHFQSKDPLEYIGKGPMRMLRLSDFSNIISKLELAGGLSGDRICAENAEADGEASVASLTR